jgi:hypothetical protein
MDKLAWGCGRDGVMFEVEARRKEEIYLISTIF